MVSHSCEVVRIEGFPASSEVSPEDSDWLFLPAPKGVRQLAGNLIVVTVLLTSYADTSSVSPINISTVCQGVRPRLR